MFCCGTARETDNEMQQNLILTWQSISAPLGASCTLHAWISTIVCTTAILTCSLLRRRCNDSRSLICGTHCLQTQASYNLQQQPVDVLRCCRRVHVCACDQSRLSALYRDHIVRRRAHNSASSKHVACFTQILRVRSLCV